MFLRQTILYLPSQLVGPLAQVVAAIVWTHWLAPGPYGVLTFIIAGQELVFVLSLSWWTQFTMRYLGSLEGAQRDSFLNSEVSVYAFTFIAQIAITLLVLAFLQEPFTANLALAAIVCNGTRSLHTHLSERARIQSRISVYTLGQFVGSVLGFAFAYAAVAFVAATPAAVLWGFAFGQGLGIAIMWQRLGVAGGDLLPGRDILKAALAYGAPLVIAGVLAWTAQNGVRIVVEKAAGAEALGLIAVGWGLGQRLAVTLAMLVIAASFPLAVKHWRADSRHEAYRQLSYGGVLLCGLILPASVGICFLAQPFVALFVAEPFRAMTIAVLPYAAAAGALRNIRMHAADPVFLLMERPRVSTLINLFDAVGTVIGCLIGLFLGGLVGAVAGCFGASIVTMLVGLILAYRIGGFSFPYADVAKIALASAVMALVLAVVPWATLSLTPMTRMIVETALGAITYAVAIATLYPALVAHAARRGRTA